MYSHRESRYRSVTHRGKHSTNQVFRLAVTKFNSVLPFALNRLVFFCLTECLLFSCRVRGGLLARLSVIDYRASLPRSLGERLFLPIGFTMIGITAGIVYWQTDTPLRIMTAYCGSSIPSLLFLCSVVFNRITRSLEVSADPRSQSSLNGARQLRAQNRTHEVILLPC